MTVGLIAAVAAAFAYALASILQAVGAARTSKGDALDPRLLLRLVKEIPYLIGLVADGVGFVLGLVAIQFLPLFLAEALISSSVGITAILAVIFLKVKLATIEKWALVGLVAGLACLAISAESEQAQPLDTVWRWVELSGVILVVIAAFVASKLPPARVGVGLAIASGLAFSGMAIAARSLDVPDPFWELIKDPTFYSVCIYGLLGVMLFATALQRASVTTVTALVFGLETVIPSIIGILFLGDSTREGMWPVASVGFILALVCTTILARQAEPEVGESDHDPASEREPAPEPS